jgi:hypothetical protein
MQGLRKPSRSLRTYDPAALLDIAKMRSRDPEKLGERRKAHVVRFSETRQSGAKRQRAAHQGLEIR